MLLILATLNLLGHCYLKATPVYMLCVCSMGLFSKAACGPLACNNVLTAFGGIWDRWHRPGVHGHRLAPIIGR